MNRTFLRRAFKTTFRVLLIAIIVLAVIPLLLDIDPIQRFVQRRLHHRIEAALTRALGRPVKGGNIDFTTLSGVGLNLENASIGEAPGFGLEPFVYAENIHFVLSLHSLISGRLELSRIALTRASINLVRDAQGRWNFETWFSSGPPAVSSPVKNSAAGSVPVTRSAARSSLPMKIDFDADRINFKDLAKFSEKNVVYLSDVTGTVSPAWFSNGIDFDLRLKPSRTDVPMENSGEIRVTGSLGPFRSASLWPAVIQGQVRMQRFPYSDMVALLTGRLTYLHGIFDARTSFRGQLNDRIRMNGRVDLMDLHTWAVVPREGYTSASLTISRADLQIGKEISLSEGTLRIGSSEIKLEATLSHLPTAQLDLTASTDGMHLEDALDFARGFTNRFSPEMQVLRDARVQYHLSGPWDNPHASAQLQFTGGEIRSPYLTAPAAFSAFGATYEDGTLFWDPIRFEAKGGHSFQVSGSLSDLSTTRRLLFQSSGHDASMQEMEGVARSFGIWPTAASVAGLCDFSLQWGPGHKRGSPSILAGHLNARNVTLKIGSSDDVHVAAAHFETQSDVSELSVTKLNWGRSVASATWQFPGLDFHRARVDVNASFLDVGELARLGQQAQRRLSPPSSSAGSEMTGSTARPSRIFNWNGKISSVWLYLDNLQVTRFQSAFILGDRFFRLDDFATDAYGGKSKGQFLMDWHGNQRLLHAEGQVENMKADSLMNMLTNLGPTVQGRVNGDFSLSADKGVGQPWLASVTAHVRATVKNLENAGLKIPPNLSDIQTRLDLPASSNDLPLTLYLDLDYGQDEIKVNEARLTQNDFNGVFTGTCSKKLDLDITGSVDKVASKKNLSAAPVSLSIHGPLKQPEIIIRPSATESLPPPAQSRRK